METDNICAELLSFADFSEQYDHFLISKYTIFSLSCHEPAVSCGAETEGVGGGATEQQMVVELVESLCWFAALKLLLKDCDEEESEKNVPKFQANLSSFFLSVRHRSPTYVGRHPTQ